jgi:hypothetical protein
VLLCMEEIKQPPFRRSTPAATLQIATQVLTLQDRFSNLRHIVRYWPRIAASTHSSLFRPSVPLIPALSMRILDRMLSGRLSRGQRAFPEPCADENLAALIPLTVLCSSASSYLKAECRSRHLNAQCRLFPDEIISVNVGSVACAATK